MISLASLIALSNCSLEYASGTRKNKYFFEFDLRLFLLGMGKQRGTSELFSVLPQSSKDRLESVESDFRSKVLGLEAELQKQRERCLVLIEEKEDEVNMLKSNMEMAFEKTFAAAAAAAAAATSSAAGPSPLSPEQDRELQLRRAAASTIASTGK